ncbi:hypothetical protein [Clostridium sp.]|uniref:hypothetical protein n=1 Tax=Clostridium sp. TaxID=1506 RepID=UPI001A502E28|nr:hypothetical protein [Clostridium sp.]MBK5242796.1 hypothetical protein [Clostridium sp.]
MNDIEVIESKIKLLEEKKKSFHKSLHTQDRKARTRLLIQTGALCEKYFDIETLSLSEREEIFKLFSSYIKNNIPVKYKKIK